MKHREGQFKNIKRSSAPTDNKENRGDIFAFVSGKGGVGKTVIVSNLGKLMAEVGKKTLLVDMDFFTHGLTFYVSKGKRNFNYCVLDLLSSEGESIEYEKISQNLYLLPSCQI